jgi:hypothetical protein
LALVSGTSRTRAKIDTYATAVLTLAAAAVFLSAVPFIPAAPFLPLVVAAVLGAVSLRESGAASAALYALAFFSILWQLIGFGFFHLLSTGPGLVVIALTILPAFAFLNRRVDAVALPLAVLAVGLMLTPQYYLSIPIVVITAAFLSLATAVAVSMSFVFLLAPFLLLENALYLSSPGSQASVPIIFAQLTNLVRSIRPPLPNLNVVITQFPPGYLYPRAANVAAFVSGHASVIAIPVVILFVLALGSASVARFAKPFLERYKLLQSETLWRLIVRLTVSVAAGVVFVAVLAVFSIPGAGGFQTSIAQSGEVAAAVVGGSAVVGASFIGVDTLSTKMEAGEVSTTALQEMLAGFNAELKRAKELLERVGNLAPSVNLGAERKTLSESESYARDLEMQLTTATTGTTSTWIQRFNSMAHPAVLELQERLRKGVIAEVAFLSSVALTANGNLSEAKVAMRYPTIEQVGEQSSLDQALEAYEKVATDIGTTTTRLFDSYISASQSFARLMGQEEIPPGVNPASLLNSHDYTTAMRLVAGEYWLDFQVKRGDEFAKEIASLKEKLEELEGSLGAQERGVLRTIAESKLKDSPSQAQLVLEGLAELKALLRDVLDSSVAEVDSTRKLISSIDPTALSIVKLETSELSGSLQTLRKELDSVGESFADLQGYVKAVTPALKTRLESLRRDELTMIVLSQYPVAARVIDSMFERRKRMKIDLLPFQGKAAALYCKLYAAANPSLQYDEIGEVLSVRDA